MKSSSKSTRFSGFTLIELLIVVAIIAILAAIAVPNFLEAQVRAKISRTMNDMRTVALSLEAYTVDYNVGPVDSGASPSDSTLNNNWKWFKDDGTRYWTGTATAGTLYPGHHVNDASDNGGNHRLICWWEAALTTPVGYVAKRTEDIFHKGEWINESNQVYTSSGQGWWRGGSFVYRNYEHYDRAYIKLNGENNNNQGGLIYRFGGYRWALFSSGPSNRGKYDQIYAVNTSNVPWFGNVTFQSYDATNGTKSEGMLVRSNKGVYSVGCIPEATTNPGTGPSTVVWGKYGGTSNNKMVR